MVPKVESGQWWVDPCHRNCRADLSVHVAMAVGIGQRRDQSELELQASAVWTWWTCSRRHLNRRRVGIAF